jgi:hypothetical protein
VAILHIVLHKNTSHIKDSAMLFDTMTEWNGECIVHFNARIEILMSRPGTTLEFSDTWIIKFIIASRTD